MVRSATLLNAMVLALFVGAHSLTAQDPVLDGLAAGEAAADAQEDIASTIGLLLVGGGVGGYLARESYDTRQEAALWAGGTGAAAGIVGYVLAGSRSDPPADVVPSGSASYREAFARGYRERVAEIRRNRALLGALVWAGAFAAGAILAGDYEDDDPSRGGVVIVPARIPWP